MAKYVKNFKGDFDQFITYIQNEVEKGSFSATIEDEEEFIIGDVRCKIIVFERYSYLGDNRVSMNVTILGNCDEIEVVAITSGGSGAVFFKINTFGEESFLDTIIEPIEKYIRNN